MSEIANARINSFASVAQQANEQPSEEPIFVLTGSQLQEIISRAIQPLQDEVSQLKITVVRQQEDIASLKSTENLNFRDIRDLYTAIDEIDQRQQIKPQPLQKDREEILRALLAANGGKMLAKEARQKMHLSKNRFSELVTSSKDNIEVREYHLKRNQHLLVLK
jgi:hypothetical protein